MNSIKIFDNDEYSFITKEYTLHVYHFNNKYHYKLKLDDNTLCEVKSDNEPIGLYDTHEYDEICGTILNDPPELYDKDKKQIICDESYIEKKVRWALRVYDRELKINHFDSDELILGEYPENSTHTKKFIQLNNGQHKGIYLYRENNQLSREFIDSVAGLRFTNITKFTDPINKDIEPEFLFEYHNLLDDQHEQYKGTLHNTIMFFKNSALFSDTEKYVKVLFERMTYYLMMKGIIKLDKGVFKIGFFYDKENHQIIENSTIKGLECTPENMQQAVDILHKCIRDENIDYEAYIYKWFLIAPFFYAMKCRGSVSDYIKYLILTGSANTNKTGVCICASHMWGYTIEEDSPQSIAALKRLITTSTFPVLADEFKNIWTNKDAYDLLKNVVMKTIGATNADLNDQIAVVKYISLNPFVATMNENNLDYSNDALIRRYHILQYDSSMKVPEDKKKDFIRWSNYKGHDSILKDMRYIGRAFADRMIPVVLDRPSELMDMQRVTINILRDIEEEYDVKFPDKMLEYQVFSSEEDIKDSVEELIRSQLKEQYNQARRKVTKHANYEDILHDFCQENHIPWLYTLSIDDRKNVCEYGVCLKEVIESISFTGGETRTPQEVSDILDLGENERRRIRRNNKLRMIKVLTWDEVYYKMFTMDVNEDDVDKSSPTVHFQDGSG